MSFLPITDIGIFSLLKIKIKLSPTFFSNSVPKLKQISQTQVELTFFFNGGYVSATLAWEWKASRLRATLHKNSLSWLHKSYISLISKRPPQLKATNTSLECELTQLKVLHECIRGISCELALWIHKAVFIPEAFHSFKQRRQRGLFEVRWFPFFFFSLRAKEDWVSLICSLYIWMSSAKSSSWSLDKGPGAETVAVPNFVSVGAVNHGGGVGGGDPTLWRFKLAFPVDLWPEGQALSSPAQRRTQEGVRRRTTHKSVIGPRTLDRAAKHTRHIIRCQRSTGGNLTGSMEGGVTPKVFILLWWETSGVKSYRQQGQHSRSVPPP